MTRARIAVLASGGGSNLQAIIDHFAALGDRRAGDVVLVGSDKPGARALARASDANIAAALIQSRVAPDGEDMLSLLRRHDIAFIALAGYLRLVPADVIREFRGRIINVHPAPLPDFGGPGMYGARVHRAVIDFGVRFSGPTVHFVDEVYDHGGTIVHWPVPVLDGDDEQSLATRVLRAEHVLFPRVVQALASGLVAMATDGSTRDTPWRASPPPFDPNADVASLATLLDQQG